MAIKLTNLDQTFLGFFALTATMVMTMTHSYDESDIKAYHFHTYFFYFNERSAQEAQDFRVATRVQIEKGKLKGCSLNKISIGPVGPHPFSQYELCCNKTWLPAAMAWHMQNHGNLSILIHPLTIHDLDDHKSKVAWIGQPVILDLECPLLYPLMKSPRPCPVYPNYADEIVTKKLYKTSHRFALLASSRAKN